jgi:hypothetical protein
MLALALPCASTKIELDDTTCTIVHTVRPHCPKRATVSHSAPIRDVHVEWLLLEDHRTHVCERCIRVQAIYSPMYNKETT